MKTKSRLLLLPIAFASCVFGVRLSTEIVDTALAANVNASAVPMPTPTVSSTNQLKVATQGGLRVVTFEAKSGRVLLLLPDDMRAGDTISGTVTADPMGQTEEERAKNLETLNGYTITLWPNPPRKKTGEGVIRLPVKEPSFTFSLPPIEPPPPGIDPAFRGFPGFNAALGPPIAQSSGNFGAADAFPGTGSVLGGILPGVVLATPNIDPSIKTPPSTSFAVPPMGQEGRYVEIQGPFDGNVGNTTLRFGPVGSTVQDFEKNTENVSGGFGLIRPLAESPRKIVIEGPTNVVGPIQIYIQEGDKKTTGTHRNLGVNLSAPKTNLSRGERTTVTVEVRGLEGLKKDVPLQLDSKGVINMDGGNFQNLTIKPSEVTPEGRYRTDRGITGVQAGGFNVTATVIVRPFDFCLQDDSDPNRLFHFNSFTGDYVFACGGGSCRPTGGTQTGQPPGSPAPTPPINLTGTGKMQMKGCIITLSHNAPDRRVFARLDACTRTGDASVETTSPKTKSTITDKNTADNTVASPPPK